MVFYHLIISCQQVSIDMFSLAFAHSSRNDCDLMGILFE